MLTVQLGCDSLATAAELMLTIKCTLCYEEETIKAKNEGE